MDSLTQIVLASSLTAAIAPANNRRAALLAGAVLGTLPDLDVFPLSWLTDNPVLLMTLHRGLTHSLFILPLAGLLIWWICKRTGHRVKAAPVRWFWAIQAALVTHPLIDALTVYGTQLYWPLLPPPAMWSVLFIIDPLYTVPLLLGCAVALFAGKRPVAQYALIAGLILSTAYVGWAFYAKAQADRAAKAALAELGYADAPYFSVPTAFNTLLWRCVALTPDGFLEGERSLVADKGKMQFRHYPSDTAALAAVSSFPNVQRLAWFNHGFMKAQTRTDGASGDTILILSDLRMGAEPDYAFNFAVARRSRSESDWQPMAPQQMARQQRGWWTPDALWKRIFNEPTAAPQN